jgi:TonB family protein
MAPSKVLVFLTVFLSIFNSASAFAVDGPITQYCHQLESLLRRDWKAVAPLSEMASIDFQVTNNGDIEEVQSSKRFAGSEAFQAVGKKVIQDLKKVDAPPYAAPNPLWLTAQLCNRVAAIRVAWRDCDLPSYVRDVKLRVKRSWFPPKGGPPARVVLKFRIDREGNASRLRLAQTSGSADLDRSALLAAQRASPFGPMPDGSPDGVDINFTLDYNLHSLRPAQLAP